MASVEDIPWAFLDSFLPRPPARAQQDGKVLQFTPLLDLSFIYRDSPIFRKERSQLRLFTLEPSLDELVDQAVEMGWLARESVPRFDRWRGPLPEAGPRPVVTQPVVKLDWYFQDQLLAFLRKKTDNEAMPSLHYLSLVQVLGRIVAARNLLLSDLARIAFIGLSDDLTVTEALADATARVEAVTDVQSSQGESLLDDVSFQSQL